MQLVIPDHLHAIEYHRQYNRDRREHVHTETVDDQGFVLVHDPETRSQWLAHYTRCCADEYLARKRAPRGIWFVHVYQLLDDERRHIVSSRMYWPGPQATARETDRSQSRSDTSPSGC